MKILTRDYTEHGVEYVTRADAEAAIAEIIRCHHDQPCTAIVLKQADEIALLKKQAIEAAKIRSAAQELHDFLWSQVGATADWPLEIKSDSEESASQLAEKLTALREMLNIEASQRLAKGPNE